jgi:hypothetical protein
MPFNSVKRKNQAFLSIYCIYYLFCSYWMAFSPIITLTHGLAAKAPSPSKGMDLEASGCGGEHGSIIDPAIITGELAQ